MIVTLPEGDSDRQPAGRERIGSPLSRFPLRGKAGAGGFPPRRSTLRASQNRWHASCAGSPHKRGCRPLVHPPLGRLGVSGLGARQRGSIQDFNERDHRSRLHKILDTTSTSPFYAQTSTPTRSSPPLNHASPRLYIAASAPYFLDPDPPLAPPYRVVNTGYSPISPSSTRANSRDWISNSRR